MCGIVGFNWDDANGISELNGLLRHRGPDQSGIYTDSLVSLAHSRLSVIDLSEHGRQPMMDEDKNVIVIFNGEIFNYTVLKEELTGKGHTFTSHSDTEVLVHLYEEYGRSMLKRLNGQFAFCIYDKIRSELFLARDRVGIIPLYFYLDTEKFIFSSELKAILSSGIEKKIDQDALVLYLRFGFISAPSCIIKGARKLEPAHYMVYDLKGKKLAKYERYWDIAFGDGISDAGMAAGLIRDRLAVSAKMRLAADVPVGAFLSGGIDSSAVVATIVRQGIKLKTFSVKFEYKEFDESSFAKTVADKLKTEHYEITLKPEDIRDIIPALVEHYDEPFGDSSAIPTYFVSKFARKYVTVCLSGDAGDELLAGYERYWYFFVARFLNRLPRWIRAVLRFKLSVLLKIKPKFEIDKVREILELEPMDDIHLYERFVEKIGRPDLESLLRRPVIYEDTTKIVGTKTGLRAIQHYDIVHYLEGDILTKVDRAAMAVSLETRPPFLDHELMEVCFKVRNGLKLKGLCGKWILKKAFKDILPAITIRRKKKGFGVPIKYYLKNELADLVEKYVLSYDKHGLFDLDFLRKMNYGDVKRDTTRLYWNILMFNMWYDKWIAKK